MAGRLERQVRGGQRQEKELMEKTLDLFKEGRQHNSI